MQGGIVGQAACRRSNQDSGTTLVVATLNALAGAQLQPVYGPARPREPLDTPVTTIRAEATLGLCAAIDLARGLRQCLELYAARSAQPSLAGPHASGLSAFRAQQ
jgi:hypothetical protein